MAAQSLAWQKSAPAHDRFYVVIETAWAASEAFVTVLRQVPAGAQELGSFENANCALEFAEIAVREQLALGVAIELVDPAHSLVGAG
jgi:hypothetical protein